MKVLVVLDQGEDYLLNDLKRVEGITIVSREYNYDSLVSFVKSDEETPDIILCSGLADVTTAPGMSKEKGMLKALRETRLYREEARIVLLLPRSMKDSKHFLQGLASYGIYDFYLIDGYDIDELETWLYEEKTLADVERYLPLDGPRNMPFADHLEGEEEEFDEGKKAKEESNVKPFNKEKKQKQPKEKERVVEKTVTKTKYIIRSVAQTVIMTYNPKGGVGKSTVSANLAQAINNSPYTDGHKVALLDLDPAGNVATICHLSDLDCYEKNMSSWDTASEDLSNEEIEETMIKTSGGLRVATPPLNFRDGNQNFFQSPATVDKILRALRRIYGVVVIDGCPGFSPAIDVAMQHASHILLVTNPEGQSVKQLARVVQRIGPDPDFPNQPDHTHIIKKMTVVLNQSTPPGEWDLEKDEVENIVGRPIMCEIPHSESVKKALHVGKKLPVDTESDFTNSIKLLANSICGVYPEGFKKRQKKGLFQRFFG